MGVYIKGMEMPKNCAECTVNMEVCNRGYKYLLEHPELYEKRADDCPLVEVKAPHGDLIERVPTIIKIENIEEEPQYQHDGEDWINGLIQAEEVVHDAPTIIEAEE